MDFREILFGVGAQMAQNVRTGNPTTEAYARGAASLMQHASKWSAVAASGIKCSVHTRTPLGDIRPCSQPAISACVVCQQPTCFHHGMISPSDGAVICFACVGAAQQRRQEEGPPLEESDPGIQCICRDPGSLDPRCPVHGGPRYGGAPQQDDETKLRRKFLRRLGLMQHASWSQIRAAHKALILENHPDRFQGAEKRKRERKVKLINEAFQWLKQYEERQAA